MGSCQDGAVRTTSPSVEISSEMIVKTSLLCLLLLSPAILTFKLLPQEESFNEARQFSEEPIINYGIWGFLAGLADYGIRNAFTMTTTTTTVATTATTTPAASTTSSTRRKHFRNKQEKKEKKEKKDRKKLKREQRKKKKEMEKMMKEEGPSVEEVVETVADIVDTADTVVEETAAEE